MRKNKQLNSGQALILTTMTLGGVLLGATAIAGMLMTNQIRQSINLAASTRAIYAADAGLEWAFYNMFCNPSVDSPCNAAPDAETPRPSFGNGAGLYAVICSKQDGAIVLCNSTSTVRIRSTGQSGGTLRTLEANF